MCKAELRTNHVAPASGTSINLQSPAWQLAASAAPLLITSRLAPASSPSNESSPPLTAQPRSGRPNARGQAARLASFLPPATNGKLDAPASPTATATYSRSDRRSQCLQHQQPVGSLDDILVRIITRSLQLLQLLLYTKSSSPPHTGGEAAPGLGRPGAHTRSWSGAPDTSRGAQVCWRAGEHPGVLLVSEQAAGGGEGPTGGGRRIWRQEEAEAAAAPPADTAAAEASSMCAGCGAAPTSGGGAKLRKCSGCRCHPTGVLPPGPLWDGGNRCGRSPYGIIIIMNCSGCRQVRYCGAACLHCINVHVRLAPYLIKSATPVKR